MSETFTPSIRYVIDASVWIADVHPTEPYHAEAHVFLSLMKEKGWIGYSPNIVLAEVAAGIARGTGQPSLALQIVSLLQRLPSLELVPVDAHLAETSAHLAASSMIRGCDAVYIALAQMIGGMLISLDKQQRTRAPSYIAASSPKEELVRLDMKARFGSKQDLDSQR